MLERTDILTNGLLENLPLFLKGFGNNLLITVLSMIIPLGLGVLLTFVATRNRTLNNVFSWISLPWECLCPVLLLLVSYYSFPTWAINTPNLNVIVAIISFTNCFSFYMPARVVPSDSFLKNILVNGVGLISAIFKWSFVVSFIAVLDLTHAANQVGNHYYVYDFYIIPLVVSVVFIGSLELAKRLFKQYLK